MGWWEWVFSGIGVSALKDWIRGKPKQSGASLNAQGAKVENSPVASGSHISQNIHSPTTINVALPAMGQDEDSWPDVILECQWPSLLLEPKIPGSRVVRKRPWTLRYRAAGAVYNVSVHRIRFGAYEAVFPFPVSTLTDAKSVYPVICRKSDGLVVEHDLESLIQQPPSGCDVRQYATETERNETDGDENEDSQFESTILEVEIPVTISYDDKNGNQFRIKYLLHYDIFGGKGEMIRLGKIEKIAPLQA